MDEWIKGVLMKNNMVLKKALRVVSFLVPFFTIACVEAREMGVKGNTQSISQRRTKSSRRTQPRYKGAQRQRSTQGRNAVRTRQQPAQQQPVERIIPTKTTQTKVVPANQPAVQASQQPVPTKVDANAAAWVRIQTWLLSEEISPSQALNVVKMLRRKNLTHEQEDWLNRFELQAREGKSRELVSASSINRPHQQTTLPQQPAIPVANGLSSVPNPQLIPVGGEIDEKKWQEIITLLNKYAQSPSQGLVEYIKNMQADDRFSDEQREFLRQYQQRMEDDIALGKPAEQSTGISVAAQPKRQGPIQQWYNDPHKTFLGFPVSNASVPQQQQIPAATQLDPVTGKSVVQQQVPVEAPVPARSKSQGPLQRAWSERPTLYQLTGGSDPSLSRPAVQAVVKQPKKSEGALITAWRQLPSFNMASLWSGDPSLSGAQLGRDATEEGWKKLKDDLMREAQNPSPALLERIKNIKKYPHFNDQQKEWLAGFEEKIEAPVQDWIKLRNYLTQRAENPSREFVEEIEKIISSNSWLTAQQKNDLRQFKKTMESLITEQETSTQQ